MAVQRLKLKAPTPSWSKHQRRLPKHAVMNPKVTIPCKVTLIEDDDGSLSVSFETVAHDARDKPLDLRIYENTVLIFQLQKSGKADWEFSHLAGITLAYDEPAAPDEDWQQNYSMVPADTSDDERCFAAQIEARKSFSKRPHNYKYNLKFKIYTSPRGTTFVDPIELFIDPDIKNPGDYGLRNKRPKRLAAKRKAAAKKKPRR